MVSKEQSERSATLDCSSPKSSSSTSSEKGVEGMILLDDLFLTTSHDQELVSKQR